MGKTQKKTGKGRLDKYYHLAKEQGYRARSAFKLIQLNKKYSFLENARVLIDLCAAPGGWLQVASKYMPVSSLILGVDLVPIKPIPKVITFAEDITTDKCRSQLRQNLKTWKADVVLHDGAPNVGTAWIQDAYSQAELVLMSLKLAVEFLNKGGTFVTKVFRSKDYNKLLWVFNQLFKSVEATKPPSSRNVSAEIFVVCRNFIAPKRIDPKFLDPKAVFEELDLAANTDVNVFHPEKHTRHREGYEDGNMTLHKKVPVMKFITSLDPIKVLGNVNQLTFETDEEKEIFNHQATSTDIRINVADLKVLGKKDFRQLIKWRLRIRDHLGLDKKEETISNEVAEVEPLEPIDEEEMIDNELERLTREEQNQIKKERRKQNEKKTKLQIRMQLSMTTPTEIGMEQDGLPGFTENEGTLFKINEIGNDDKLEKVLKSDMAMATAEEKSHNKDGDIETIDSDDEFDVLEDELDQLYEDYKDRKAEKDAKYRVRKLRGNAEEWRPTGEKKLDDDEDDDEDDDKDDSEDEGNLRTRVIEEEMSLSDLSTSSEESEKEELKPILKAGIKRKRGNSDNKTNGSSHKLSKSASLFFSQPLFKDIINELETDKKDDREDGDDKEGSSHHEDSELDEENGSDNDDIEIVPGEKDDEKLWDADDSDDEAARIRKNQDIGLITAEAMTLAQQLVNRKKTMTELVDEGFNKWAFNDKDELPQWFLDEESQYNKPNLPITKEAVAAIRERMRALNVRPIKKIAEAKARKKFKAAQKLTKMQKKADTINESDMTEKEKASSISKLLSKKSKKQKKDVKVVVARGAARGIKGRPKGVKGRYLMVDRRMKKELRAKKRASKSKKSKH